MTRGQRALLWLATIVGLLVTIGILNDAGHWSPPTIWVGPPCSSELDRAANRVICDPEPAGWRWRRDNFTSSVPFLPFAASLAFTVVAAYLALRKA